MSRSPLRLLVSTLVAACSWAAPARAADAPLDAFFAGHPCYEVLPAPYFESDLHDASWAEVGLNARSFLGAGVAWHAELDTGIVRRFPAQGTTSAKGWNTFVALGESPVAHAELRLYAHEHGTERLAARIALPRLVPERFVSTYVRGPFARQLSPIWGEDGAWLVLLQGRYKPAFWRHAEPVLYVGGDFNYRRIEGVVRFLRTHGVNALGYKPDYDRNQAESFLDMAQADLADIRSLITLAAGGRPTDVVGMCVGGLYARGLAYAERRVARPAKPLVASVTTVGTPHQGSELADIYNSVGVLPLLHRFVTGGAAIHKYKDSRLDVQRLDRVVGTIPEVPTGSVVLDPAGHPLDPRYLATAWPLRWLVAAETGVRPETVGTDGLITVAGQSFGKPMATWTTDHAGMINDGFASTYFDAYSAHLRLIDALNGYGKRGL